MKAESYLFAGVAVFFAVTAATYAWFGQEPAGAVALTIAFLMSALVAFFFRVQYRRRGGRLQDRPGVRIAEGTGPLDFFAPHSGYPVLAAAGTALLAVGAVYGWWPALLGVGMLVPGVFGFVFQYTHRGE